MRAYANAASVDRNQRDRLIAEHIEVARRIALRVARRVPDWMNADDLIAAAMVGLTEAAERYDNNREEPFVAFAERRIRGAVLDELRRGDIMPRRVRTKARKLGLVLQQLEQRFGREPEDDEVAKELGISLDEYQENLKMLNHVSLVDMDLTGAGERHTATSAMASPAAAAERSELKQRILDALPQLPERDALLLSLYYNEELTYAEIGIVLGVGESRVCQLHSRAITRLRTEIDTPSAKPAERARA